MVIFAGGDGDRDNQRALGRRHVHDGDVDVGRQLLLCAVSQAALLQGVTQFSCRHRPRNRLVEADRRGNRELGPVLEVGRHVGAGVGHHDVGLRTPDDVVGALHHLLIGLIQRDVAGHHQCVLEAFEDVLECDPFFFAKTVSHCSLSCCYLRLACRL